MTDGNDAAANKAAEAKALENMVLSAKKGDWQAKDLLTRQFLGLLTSMAEKRSSDPEEVNRLMEAGKQGLLTAASKYKPSVGAENFRIFAIDYIEAKMDRAGKGGGFLSRLFGKK